MLREQIQVKRERLSQWSCVHSFVSLRVLRRFSAESQKYKREEVSCLLTAMTTTMKMTMITYSSCVLGVRPLTVISTVASLQ